MRDWYRRLERVLAPTDRAATIVLLLIAAACVYLALGQHSHSVKALGVAYLLSP